jgi:hypothetical protein
MIANALNTGFTRATGAAVESVVRLDAVPDDFAAAVVADWSQLVNRALKAIEDVPVARRNHLKG